MLIGCFCGRYSRSERATQAQAANFLVQRAPGEIHADNTDGSGLIADLTRNLGIPLRGASMAFILLGGAFLGRNLRIARRLIVLLLPVDVTQMMVKLPRVWICVDAFLRDANGLLHVD